MKAIGKYLDHAMHGTMVVSLALMVIMVFGNVVLRYLFNSGITMSEELSRLLFLWLIFVGSVVAMKEHAHLGVDTLVSRLPRGGKVFCATNNGSGYIARYPADVAPQSIAAE